MIRQKKTDSAQEKQAERERADLFCTFAAMGYPPGEAARRAGWGAGACQRQGAAMLGDGRVRRKIARLRKELAFCAPAELARAGLERLALGDADGALALLEEDGPPPDGDTLFHVAELKRPKGGGIELKFFDRLKALELLAGLEDREAAGPGSLLAALERSARGLGEAEGGDG